MNLTSCEVHSPFRRRKRHLSDRLRAISHYAAVWAAAAIASRPARNDALTVSRLLLAVTHPHQDHVQMLVEKHIGTERRASARLSGDLDANVVEAQIAK